MLRERTSLEMPSTRERILNAVREVFERNGTRGTTTREVAERAGVNEATLFRHFHNKTSLLDAMREWVIESSGYDAVFDDLTGNLVTDLVRICTRLYERMLQNQAIIRISLAEEATDPDQVPTCLRGPTEIRQRLTNYLQAQVDSGIVRGNAVQLATMMAGMTLALAIKSKRVDWGEEAKPELLIPYFVDALLNGVKK
ncbi:MAG: TetR/AcrR family transcriptional regulator [Vulcanimicrobiaceae bacterium]